MIARGQDRQIFPRAFAVIFRHEADSVTLAAQVILAPGDIIARHYEDHVAVLAGEVIHRRQVVTYRRRSRLQLLPEIIHIVGPAHVYADVGRRGQVELLRHAFQHFLRVNP